MRANYILEQREARKMVWRDEEDTMTREQLKRILKWGNWEKSSADWEIIHYYWELNECGRSE